MTDDLTTARAAEAEALEQAMECARTAGVSSHERVVLNIQIAALVTAVEQRVRAEIVAAEERMLREHLETLARQPNAILATLPWKDPSPAPLSGDAHDA